MRLAELLVYCVLYAVALATRCGWDAALPAGGFRYDNAACGDTAGQ
jgi:hypothetical protein